ncbi:hypothetical protein EC036_13040 [Enterobacter cloacae]|uniref:Uncharacterized protein n=1 Tax=Enterobacter cloacae subsp. cloacae (strain ATCC 13047 / DSM 30054 / NBRC 13535 / NCTC 10005 / WDCM 00083 / NCDC 279-56) TaxID=716541 RepID=A0A0H3CMD8_ENTCC|nr:hypothetical protein ECL_02956 [Enterobacter cloacae subsp. cloacae ATCC 13047]AIV28951.1 hypothetical protein EC036_13040 [Enterobacter cloacae]
MNNATVDWQKLAIKIFCHRLVGKTGNLLSGSLYGLDAVIHYSCG